MIFENTTLDKRILDAVKDLGFYELTPIQEKAIPTILNDSADLIALAQTGTGKTAAFGLPILHKIDLAKRQTQAMVIAPTRELCLQITRDLHNFSKYLEDINVTPVYGGANIDTQIKQLKRGSHIVVATPGRALDLIRRKSLRIDHIEWLVLDEADEMLSMGFKDDLDEILQNTPSNKQTMLFSATMPKEIERIANNYMRQPVEITVGKKNTGASNVEHIYYLIHSKDRYEALKRIADANPDIYAIVFCRTRQETKDIADKLMSDGYNADALHGDLSQTQRDTVMSHFRSTHLQILVATDVAARGLDVSNLSHAINYNLPDDTEIYTHRSGRTGRAGKSGISVSLVHLKEKGKIKDIERVSGIKFVRHLVPGGIEICEKQLFKLIDKVEKIEVNHLQIRPFLDAIYDKFSALSREELIQHFVSVEFNRFLAYYKDAMDINVTESSERREKTDRNTGNREKNYSRFYINVGNNHGLNPARLIGVINQYTKNRDISIGKIDIMKKFSFFEVGNTFAEIIEQSFKDAEFEGVKLFIEKSESETRSSGGGGGYKGKKTDDNSRDKKSDFNRRRSSGSSENRAKQRTEGRRKKY